MLYSGWWCPTSSLNPLCSTTSNGWRSSASTLTILCIIASCSLSGRVCFWQMAGNVCCKLAYACFATFFQKVIVKGVLNVEQHALQVASLAVIFVKYCHMALFEVLLLNVMCQIMIPSFRKHLDHSRMQSRTRCMANWVACKSWEARVQDWCVCCQWPLLATAAKSVMHCFRFGYVLYAFCVHSLTADTFDRSVATVANSNNVPLHPRASTAQLLVLLMALPEVGTSINPLWGQYRPSVRTRV